MTRFNLARLIESRLPDTSPELSVNVDLDDLLEQHDLADIEVDLVDLLGDQRQIAVLWSVEDVQCVRPDLSDDQAWEVLRECRRSHDCAIGINWASIQCVADMLFDEPEEPAGYATLDTQSRSSNASEEQQP